MDLNPSQAPHQEAKPSSENPQDIVNTHAHEAIVKAGGNPDLLMPHVTAKLGWRKSDDGHVVFAEGGEGAEGSDSVVEALKQDPKFKAAFTLSAPSQAPSSGETFEPTDTSSVSSPKSGSGASPAATVAPALVNANDPLAVGYALKDIASGKARVRFNA